MNILKFRIFVVNVDKSVFALLNAISSFHVANKIAIKLKILFVPNDISSELVLPIKTVLPMTDLSDILGTSSFPLHK